MMTARRYKGNDPAALGHSTDTRKYLTYIITEKGEKEKGFFQINRFFSPGTPRGFWRF
jgi:hypothetical protein